MFTEAAGGVKGQGEEGFLGAGGEGVQGEGGGTHIEGLGSRIEVHNMWRAEVLRRNNRIKLGQVELRK